MRDGSPPKLHGHDTVQLQLSATVAVSFHDRLPRGRRHFQQQHGEGGEGKGGSHRESLH